MNADASVLLDVKGLTKAFGNQLALDSIDISINAGEVHAIVGENGAGKSTFIKVLAGRLTPESGTVSLRDREIRLSHGWNPRKAGISFVHQAPGLVDDMSVSENLILGSRYQRGPFGLVSWKRQNAYASRLLERVGLGEIPPQTPLRLLTPPLRQLVAIARALESDPDLLVLDEVTASLNGPEVELVLGIVRSLRDQGNSIIYVSHRLEEIFSVADRVSTFRNGRRVDTRAVPGTTQPELTELIVGRELVHTTVRRRQSPTVRPGPPALSVRGLKDEILHDVSFDVRRGEVVGLAGLAGSGQNNILESIFGLRKPGEGSFWLDGEPMKPDHPGTAIQRGVALVTEDRTVNGFIPDFSIAANISLPWLKLLKRSGILNFRKESHVAQDMIEKFDIRTLNAQTQIKDLSGGNQQKTILARWLSQPLKLLLLAEPTHGVDVGAKYEIYERIDQMAEDGLSIVVVSSELEELERLCDRVLIIRDGRVADELQAPNLRHQEILKTLLASKETSL